MSLRLALNALTCDEKAPEQESDSNTDSDPGSE